MQRECRTRCTSTQARSTASTTTQRRVSTSPPPSSPGTAPLRTSRSTWREARLVGRYLASSGLLKRAVVNIVAGQANVGFLCNAEHLLSGICRVPDAINGGSECQFGIRGCEPPQVVAASLYQWSSPSGAFSGRSDLGSLKGD